METRQPRTEELKNSPYASHALSGKSRKLLPKYIFVIEAGKKKFLWRKNMAELPNIKIDEI